ncbi:helix-turn-helix transcriptional regulator [Calothrix sp. FACHB-1219]|uniref:helix-turn-helix transcriptional regulator n=1 Tax=unclassified Calothrix TaxID=2619626 RepID=UPI0016877D02|nr:MULTISPECIES: helix-turn-helix transcriptional regulator [unclassified Calothrix]MBD2207963.1 helix-turn-helix transcriptional regulator [Calothrix sp. FACHB-168]MBD2222515.1 helix-turn-helix transcriptional regulator [Calothrix sp. FACHB-1219]
MVFSDNENNLNLLAFSEKQQNQKNPTNDDLQPLAKFDLLQAIIESFVDGVLIVSPEGKLIHTNEYARAICRQLMPKDADSSAIPQEIWYICQSLIESSELFTTEKVIIESEIQPKPTIKLRVRARWLELSASPSNFLLVTIEDCNQHSQSIAIADAKKYNLTEREIEVWQLRLANLSYKEIANKLFITINTVKKHLQNIHAKQQDINNLHEYNFV